MRILIYGINYTPELTGIGKYTGEMGAWLAQQGHEVSVITAMPYYPEWKIHKDYKGKWWHTEQIDGARVYRCPLYVPKNVSSIKRIIHEASFLASLFPVWLNTLLQKKYDIVVCLSPPFHLGLLPLLYTKLRGAKLITHIQDLQVDAAKDLGMIKNERFLNIMFGAERYLLRNSTAVSTISLGMQRKLENKGLALSKLLRFPNWVDEMMIRPLPKEQSLRQEFGLQQDDKVILYSGNLGEKQGLELIIEVAEEFRNLRDVYFLIVGSGGGEARLKGLVDQSGLTNVLFFPLQPYEKLSALLATADLHLVLQKGSASDLVMPSKLTGILAAGGCALVTANPGTSLYEVIDTNKAGILIKPESAQALKEGIETALASELSVYRINARAYAEKHLSKYRILKDFEQALIKLSR